MPYGIDHLLSAHDVLYNELLAQRRSERNPDQVTSYPDDGDDGDVRDIARALRRRKLLLIGIPIVFIAIAFGFAQAQDPVYSASAWCRSSGRPPPLDGTGAPGVEGDRLVRGERDFVESDAARSEVTRRIGDHEQISTSATEGRDVIDDHRRGCRPRSGGG